MQKNPRNAAKLVSFFAFWLSILFLCSTPANGQGSRPAAFHHDPNFPSAGRINAGLMTTYAGIVPPPAVVGDVTYGVSDRIGLGVLGGTTGALALAGVKFNARLIQLKRFQVTYRMVVIYYPPRHGRFLFDRTPKHVMPWMLSMGVLDAEWRFQSGIRISFGTGLLETHCIEGMRKYLTGRGDAEHGEESPFDVFNTLQGSVSIPVSKKLILRPEVITVLKGGALVERGAFKVFPVNPYMKFIYSF